MRFSITGELGVDADRQAVADDQNRRVAQGEAVAEQLLERGVEVLARRLVFPGESAAPEHVGITRAPADDAILFLEQIARFAAGLGHGQQLAQVEEMALRALLFVQAASRAAGTPFLNKVLGRHGVGRKRWRGKRFRSSFPRRRESSAVLAEPRLVVRRLDSRLRA